VREYVVRFARSARKELERLDSDLIARIFSRIEALSRNPRPAGCRKLRGRQNLWRIRVGQYRIVYEVLDDAGLVDVLVVRHRKDAYQ
jgi:mRNA interferase RelE/StbE